MRTLYLECNMGASDTMLFSALYEICEKKAEFYQSMSEAFAPFDIHFSIKQTTKCGVSGSRVSFHMPDFTPKVPNLPEEINTDTSGTVNNDNAGEKAIDPPSSEEHLNYLLAHVMTQHKQEQVAEEAIAAEGKKLPKIPETITELALPESVKNTIVSIYQLLNDTTKKLQQPAITPLPLESEPVARQLVTIAGCALLLHLITPDEILCSPLHIGNGFLKEGKAIVSVPSPITAELLKEVPCYTSSISGALVDATNAAILKQIVTHFGVMPAMLVKQIGYGIGSKRYEIANYTRAFLGTTDLSDTSLRKFATQDKSESFSHTDTILSIACNIDDMTGEALSLATEILLAAGAIDVYTTSIQMKKNRPGVLLTCLCEEADKEKFTGLFFLHTSAQELRYQTFTRAKLESTVVSKRSSFGNVRVKKSRGYGVEKEKIEFEDLKSIVLKNGITIAEIEFDE